MDIDRVSNDGSCRAFIQEWFLARDCDVDLSDCSIGNTSSIDAEKADDMIIGAGRELTQTGCAMLTYDDMKVANALTLMSDGSRKAIELFLGQQRHHMTPQSPG